MESLILILSCVITLTCAIPDLPGHCAGIDVRREGDSEIERAVNKLWYAQLICDPTGSILKDSTFTYKRFDLETRSLLKEYSTGRSYYTGKCETRTKLLEVNQTMGFRPCLFTRQLRPVGPTGDFVVSFLNTRETLMAIVTCIKYDYHEQKCSDILGGVLSRFNTLRRGEMEEIETNLYDMGVDTSVCDYQQHENSCQYPDLRSRQRTRSRSRQRQRSRLQSRRQRQRVRQRARKTYRY